MASHNRLRVYARDLGWIDSAGIISGWDGRLVAIGGLPAEITLYLHPTLPFDMVILELDNWCVVEPGFADQYFVAKVEKRSAFLYHFRVVEYPES